jgi:hypothetical protein
MLDVAPDVTDSGDGQDVGRNHQRIFAGDNSDNQTQSVPDVGETHEENGGSSREWIGTREEHYSTRKVCG